MRIVVLDGHALNPGDLSWEALAALGELTVYDRCEPGQELPRARGAQIVLVNKVVFDEARFARLGDLQYLGVTATGYNIVDIRAARKHGVVVTNVPAYSTRSVAQMVFALLLEMTQQVGHHSRMVREESRWSGSPDFCFWDRPLHELDGRVLGLVGFGQIGRQVACIGRAFGMQVLVHTAHPGNYAEHEQRGEVTFVSLDEVFRRSDVISLHCPLTERTRSLVDASRLSLVKPSALLINTARGALLDEAAVGRALADGRLGGLGVDVLSCEPPDVENPLLCAPNTFITPHIAWATREARQRLMDIVVDNVRAFLAGQPQNVVS
ncbi:MAG: D-2-hydroxyacid dehydrogenase [Syntrophotalea acetylenica]|jgi:glycerate dehydrogenase|uniref:Glycerate dehydrogenase n=1 Tax=Syntrophotalea acetylenica TaxID=29542 RepID=A0A1L3GGW1_SYNAC|nr:D-2-hydroxyacid dehydrogenase [Syntrophotalea acetylenica]APG25130.1 glycerate dehydrogenase [Syntrophotalea acetylenica]APG43199.1 glycerate dehydrogenase [Syntrophotalea acetylenica]MDD4456118.1 D-2-hydroxyacid dehydrogenase [Syntrophotalea acetylenica]MDY0261396.1 D-2-hydroxyacid dehydrogenase [Syntrophotalea acetylenica]